jgi:hypothetical protein
VTSVTAAALRTVAFGDLVAGLWGALLAGEQSLLALGAGDAAEALPGVTVEGLGPDTDWRIAGDGVELVVSGEGESLAGAGGDGEPVAGAGGDGEPVAGAGGDGEPVAGAGGDGFEQLCTVRGRITVGGAEHELDCTGVRGSSAEAQLAAVESFRDVRAWFDRDEGVALVALRPRKSPAHAGDTISATVLDLEDGPVGVADPRLSTTYGASDVPARTGLELWIGEDEADQYPRRFAGEAPGPRVSATWEGFELSATLLRCHSRGRLGTGVYLLARRG